MATANNRAKCSICNKGNITYVCPGCSEAFCFQHLTEHRQILHNQLEETINNYNQFQQAIIQKKQNPLNSSLIEQINQWETDSIHQIQQIANECRETLKTLIQKSISDIEDKFLELSQKLKETREENEVNDIDLNNFQLKLTQITEELNEPSNISVRQDSQEFIKKISVISSSSAKQLSTNDNKPTSNSTEQRVFARQGSLVFGTSAANITIIGNNHEDDSYEPNVFYKPIVQLSAVAVKTGEEDENVLFCEHGKLYRFDTAANQMKERGVGEMKILQHKTTKVCRILMRREQVLNLCANHRITSQMELKPHQGSENAYVWSAMDFADGKTKHETLCIRFKSGDVAKRFVKQFNDAKEMNLKKSDDLPSVGKISLTDKTKTTANDDDVISIVEVKSSAEQIDRAKKLQSPSTSSNTASQYDNKPSIFGSFNGSSSIFGSSTPLNNTNGSIFGGNTSSKPSNNATSGFAFPGFGGGSGAATTPSNGFQFSTPTAIFTTTTTTTTTTTNTNPTFSFGSTNKPLIDNSPKFSFSDLSKQTSTNANGQQ
ncbi:unnamed protein product [Adineta steineri]|uniref:RanBD1 domain-containing protein n=1 Tax=Adineta steineri TaxID=433720 RepID=A0A815F623_9BILA|nr:unnamed protein product [Adineta steineri]CAF3508092.1 unnamed protein product [Adineta steineri]